MDPEPHLTILPSLAEPLSDLRDLCVPRLLRTVVSSHPDPPSNHELASTLKEAQLPENLHYLTSLIIHITVSPSKRPSGVTI